MNTRELLLTYLLLEEEEDDDLMLLLLLCNDDEDDDESDDEAMETTEDTRTGSNSNDNLQDICEVYLPEHNMDVEEDGDDEDDDDDEEEEEEEKNEAITIKEEPISLDVKSEPESFDDSNIDIDESQHSDLNLEDVMSEVKKECGLVSGNDS